MTGEMSSINEDGLDSNGGMWGLHAAVAKAVNGTLHPFDTYQGPYIQLSEGGKLWVQTSDGFTFYVIHSTKAKAVAFYLDSEEGAAEAGKALIAMMKSEVRHEIRFIDGRWKAFYPGCEYAAYDSVCDCLFSLQEEGIDNNEVLIDISGFSGELK